MRIQLGILVCLLAGCATQPTWSNPSSAEAPTAVATTACLPLQSQVLRIGIEDLPPDENAPQNEPARAVPQNPIFAPSGGEQGSGPDGTRRGVVRTAPRTDYSRIDDPIVRETMHFVDDLMAADRHRVRREVGLPFFDVPNEDEERGPLLTSEQALETDRQQWLQDHGTALLRQPVQKLLRRLPIARELDLAFANFRDDHLVLGDEGVDRRPFARISVRIHANDRHDPLEIACILSGLTLASSQDYGKVTFSCDLTSTIDLELRARTHYADGKYDLRADLAVHASPYTSYHVALGDNMDFLTTSSLYSLFESPMDGSPGLVLYAAHIF